MKKSTISTINTAILLLILLVLIGTVIFAVVAIRRVLAPIVQTERAIQETFEEIANPTPTIVPDPVTIIREVRSLSRLETASYTIEKVITAESRQGTFSFLFGDRLILVAHGQVIAGVDLSKLADSDIIIAEGDVVYVALPPAEVFVATVNNQRSYVFDRDTGVIGLNPDLETEARKAAEEEILNAALEDGVLEMAQENAETYVRHLILTLGFKRVIFTTTLPTPTPQPTATPAYPDTE